MRIWGFFHGGPARARGPSAPPAIVPAVATVASTRLCPAPPPGAPALVLPAAEPSRDLRLDVDRPGGVTPADWKGKLTVDGVVTAATWPLVAPQVYRLPDGRSLLEDTYAEHRLSLWAPATRTLTELGRSVTMPVGDRRLLHLSDGTTAAFHAIDPVAPRLGELHRITAGGRRAPA